MGKDFPEAWVQDQFKLLGIQNVQPTQAAAMAACALIAIGGGLILTNLLPRLGCFFVLAFLVPATYFQHFLPMQAAKDEKEKMMEMIMVMKNVALMGGALMLFGYECGVKPKEARPGKGKMTGAQLKAAKKNK